MTSPRHPDRRCEDTACQKRTERLYEVCRDYWVCFECQHKSSNKEVKRQAERQTQKSRL